MFIAYQLCYGDQLSLSLTSSRVIYVAWRRQAIIQAGDNVSIMALLYTKFNEILITMWSFIQFKKMYFKMSLKNGGHFQAPVYQHMVYAHVYGLFRIWQY